MFLGTYFRKIEKDGCVRIPRGLRNVLEKDRYEGFFPLLSLEATEEGNRFFYLQLKPVNGDANRTKDSKLWVPLATNILINPYAETKLVFIGVDDHVEIWSPRNWDLFEREYSPKFEKLIESIETENQRKAI